MVKTKINYKIEAAVVQRHRKHSDYIIKT